VVDHSSSRPVCMLDCADVLCMHFGIQETDDVSVSSRISRASVVYKVGQHLTIGFEEEPDFGKIEHFICVQHTDDWFVVVSCLQTIYFVSHFHSYNVQEVVPKSYKVRTFADLPDFPAVCFCKKTVHGMQNHAFCALAKSHSVGLYHL